MERRLTAMKIHQYMQQNERGYYYSVITNDGEEVILSGCGIKMFDCQKERIVQTISRFRNAIFALSHSQNKLFAVNASEKNNITCIVYERINGSYVEVQRQTIKAVNVNGGGPYFDNDEKSAFFCTAFHDVWRYSIDDGTCTCIYHAEHPDQMLYMDVYADQLLVTLTSTTHCEHCGIDVLDKNGKCIKSLRYHDEKAKCANIQGRWLNADEILIIYPRFYREPHDECQIISWRSATLLDYTVADWNIERTGSYLAFLCISPMRNYIACVFVNMENNKDRYKVGIYRVKTLEKVCEFTVKHYRDATFSDNDKYFFLCSDKYLRVDLSTSDTE